MIGDIDPGELRDQLNSRINSIDEKASHTLHSKVGADRLRQSGIDVLIALHACDTATDDAIWTGIQVRMTVFVCESTSVFTLFFQCL